MSKFKLNGNGEWVANKKLPKKVPVLTAKEVLVEEPAPKVETKPEPKKEEPKSRKEKKKFLDEKV